MRVTATEFYASPGRHTDVTGFGIEVAGVGEAGPWRARGGCHRCTGSPSFRMDGTVFSVLLGEQHQV